MTADSAAAEHTSDKGSAGPMPRTWHPPIATTLASAPQPSFAIQSQPLSATKPTSLSATFCHISQVIPPPVLCKVAWREFGSGWHTLLLWTPAVSCATFACCFGDSIFTCALPQPPSSLWSNLLVASLTGKLHNSEHPQMTADSAAAEHTSDKGSAGPMPRTWHPPIATTLASAPQPSFAIQSQPLSATKPTSLSATFCHISQVIPPPVLCKVAWWEFGTAWRKVLLWTAAVSCATFACIIVGGTHWCLLNKPTSLSTRPEQHGT